ncbi:hypothetical protein [Flavobacterium sp.]|uniref:hypothetical protein n=1 Tax=Flavobacterium sp. TaxID=239 RepID=UPI003D2A0A36
MTKTIFLFLVLIAIVQFSHAQSDATLEETISWLNVYGLERIVEGTKCHSIGEVEKQSSGKFTGFVKFSQRANNKECITMKKGSTYYLSSGFGSCGCYWEYYVYDSELIKWSVSKTTTHYILNLLDKHGHNVSYNFPVESESEKVDRVIKAIKHLFKLQNINIPFEDKRSLENKF